MQPISQIPCSILIYLCQFIMALAAELRKGNNTNQVKVACCSREDCPRSARNSDLIGNPVILLSGLSSWSHQGGRAKTQLRTVPSIVVRAQIYQLSGRVLRGLYYDRQTGAVYTDKPGKDGLAKLKQFWFE